MGIPLSIFLIPFAVLFLLYLAFSYFSLYHMFRFGVTNFTTFFTSFMYIAVSVIIIFLAYERMAGIDWHREIQIFSSLAQPSGFF